MTVKLLTNIKQSKHLVAFSPILVFFAYYLANPETGWFYDYTMRIAGALLHGKLGLQEQPPNWLNEMIPHNGMFYSAFPLGSVLTMLPVAALKQIGWINNFPGTFMAALLAAMATVLFFLLSARYQDNLPRKILLTLFPVLGTWMWANLAFAGSWHIALGVAVVGQLAALYFILIRFNPFLAGTFFAIAFGNRTEILLLTPIFMYLIYRRSNEKGESANRWQSLDRFIAVPFALGIATLGYNYARFDSPFDFGYARIPGVLEEPWYQHGIFSLYSIGGNVQAMLFEPWNRISRFPYFVPTGFGGSIFISSPFLIYLFRFGSRDATLKWLSWLAIVVLTLVLWTHGNPGGWQFSYRYAMELLPWMFLILLENSPPKVRWHEFVLFVVSLAINTLGTWLFLRSELMRY